MPINSKLGVLSSKVLRLPKIFRAGWPKKPRVIFYYRFLGLGGVEAAIINRIEAIRSNGIEGEFWFSEYYGEGAKYMHSRNFIRKVDLKDRATFNEIEKYDALTVIDYPELIKTLEAEGCPIPVIYETHAGYLPSLERYYSVLKSELISALVVPSEFNRNLILETGDTCADVMVIPNCLDTNLFSAEALPTEVPRATRADGPVVLWVGRLEDEKNPQELISIARAVESRHSEVRFLVIGDTPKYDEYMEKLRIFSKGRIPESLSFLRRVSFEQMPGFYRMAAKSGGLLLSTSKYESAPMTFIEAMACGCLVLSSDVGGAGELISDGETGFLYELSNIDEAAEIICRYTASPNSPEHNAIIRNGLGYISSTHTPEIIATRYNYLLKTIFRKTRRGDIARSALSW
jgi:glycosyltransferase involved in cell wall biosynthesis